MRSNKEIFDSMVDEMPYRMIYQDDLEPYILEAMDVYAKEYHKSKVNGLEKSTEAALNMQNVIASKPDIKAAINHAISAIYFNDNSDYLTALYGVVCSLANLEDPDNEEVKKLFKELNP